jgi:hypothetical protein
MRIAIESENGISCGTFYVCSRFLQITGKFAKVIKDFNVASLLNTIFDVSDFKLSSTLDSSFDCNKKSFTLTFKTTSSHQMI